MATKKTVKKTTKKQKDVKYIVVDLTNITCPRDVYTAFAVAKMDNVLTETEKIATINEAIDTLDKIARINAMRKKTVEYTTNPIVKKPNIFKRFWNWITRKK